MCLFSMGVLVAPVVGPILGASIASVLGWRWIFWLLLILVSLARPTTIYTPDVSRMALSGAFVLLRVKRHMRP
jgi:MFS family permease